MNTSKLDLLKRMAKNMNESTNIVLPYYNKFKQVTKLYFRENEIKEISINDFAALTHLKKELAKKVLIDLNLDIFRK